MMLTFSLFLDYFTPVASLPHRSYIIVFVFSFLFVLIFFETSRWNFTQLEKKVFIIYFLYWWYALSLCLFSEDVSATFRGTLSYFINRVVVFMIFLLCFHSRYGSSFYKIPLYISIILSIQSMILFLLGTVLQIDVSSSIVYAHSILGFGDGTGRLQSYFFEANKFAQFLVYPFFLSVAHYKKSGIKIYLFIAALIYCTIFLTYSVTVNLAIILTFAIYILLKRENLGSIVLFSIILLSGIFMIYSTYYEYLIYNPLNLNSPFFLGKEISYIERIAEQNYSWEIFMENPWGIGFISHENSSLIVDKRFSNAALEEIVRMGLLGIILRALLILFVMLSLRNLIIKKGNKIKIYIGLSFLCLMLASLVYGPFDQVTALFVLTAFLTFDKNWSMRSRDIGDQRCFKLSAENGVAK